VEQGGAIVRYAAGAACRSSETTFATIQAFRAQLREVVRQVVVLAAGCGLELLIHQDGYQPN
jgi:hypothetical protein